MANSSVVKIFLCFLYLILITSKFCVSGDEIEQTKNRRGGTVGLFAFPRVGRSDPSVGNWDGLNSPYYEEYDDDPARRDDFGIKRSGLVAFPRVGRSDDQLGRKWLRVPVLRQRFEKRTGASANSGLWFGPRLGRIQKRNTDANDHQTGDNF